MSGRRYEVIEIPDPNHDLNMVAEKLEQIPDLKQVIHVEYTRIHLETMETEPYPGFKWPLFAEKWGWRILIEREAEKG